MKMINGMNDDRRMIIFVIGDDRLNSIWTMISLVFRKKIKDRQFDKSYEKRHDVINFSTKRN